MNEHQAAPQHGKPSGAHEPFDPFGPIDLAAGADCSAMVARLYNFLDGELTEQRRAKIQNHLEACPSCFSAFDFEAELRIVIATRCVSRVPDSLAERIRNAICQE
jgi:mycothiol system anti-sigma-R factor